MDCNTDTGVTPKATVNLCTDEEIGIRHGEDISSERPIIIIIIINQETETDT